MDPTTALSLACQILELVRFSTEVVTKCREVYKDGSLSQNEELEAMAVHLTGLRAELHLQSLQENQEILDLGGKCSDTAQELITELHKLKINGPHTMRQVIGKTIKSMRKKSAIETIQNRLNQNLKILNGRIFVDIRCVRINLTSWFPFRSEQDCLCTGLRIFDKCDVCA